MKAQIWRIEVVDGVLDFVHGWGRTILELYIPEMSMSVNAEHTITESTPDRYKDSELIQEIDLPQDLSQQMEELRSALKIKKSVLARVKEDFLSSEIDF